MTTQEIEIAIWALWARKRSKVVCPNISWGLLNHECDILVLEENLTLTEVEIKISKSDLKADGKKPHGHNDKRVAKLYFAIPSEMNRPDCLELIPERAGIIICTKISGGYTRAEITVKPKRNPYPYKVSQQEIIKLSYLLQFRYWKERAKNNNLTLKLKNLNQLKLF